MSKEIKKISAEDFLNEGYLQEVNRLFFHPLGLALELNVDDDTGDASFGGCWDYRDDPEGMRFGPLDSCESIRKARNVELLRELRCDERSRLLGYIVQPVGDSNSGQVGGTIALDPFRTKAINLELHRELIAMKVRHDDLIQDTNSSHNLRVSERRGVALWGLFIGWLIGTFIGFFVGSHLQLQAAQDEQAIPSVTNEKQND